MRDLVLPRNARLFAAVIGVAGLATILLQIVVSAERDGTGYGLAFAHMLRFFTLWTNTAGALVFLSIALGKGHSSRVMLALATAYAVVALVYHALLARTHHPVGLDVLTNLMFHTLLPAAAIGWWFAFAPRPEWRQLPFVMIAPMIYTLFALAVGAATQFYPYFFLDQPRLGWGGFAGWTVALAVFFIVMGAILEVLRRTVRREGVKTRSL